MSENVATVVGFARDVTAGRFPVVPDAIATAVALRDRLLEEVMIQPILETPFEARTAVRREALETGQIPENFLERILSADDGRERAQARSRELVQLQKGVDDAFPGLIRTHIDEILTGLRGQMEQTVKALRAAYATLGEGFDIDFPDAVEMAALSAEAHKAMVHIGDLTNTYRTIRRLQFETCYLGASVPSLGDNAERTWADVKRQGVMDLQGLTEPGLPGADLPKRAAVRAVVTRRDVWLPSIEDLREKWVAMFGTSGFAVVTGDRQSTSVPHAGPPYRASASTSGVKFHEIAGSVR